jgi:selenocysteine-specific elongation factor
VGAGVIIGTAGHIDHGKSALVQALTGRDMDPLAEERRRGITLDLHFAPLQLPDGTLAGMVDVPGHEDLIRSMVAGAAGLDLVLLVIAADEGIMPQTREHLAIVEQLRIPSGIPVITKIDLVDPEWLVMVQAEIEEWLSRSPVSFSPAVPVSVRTGAGLEVLRSRVAAGLAGRPTRGAAADLLRLPIDRVFSLPGAGTVVTGTLWSGRLAVGDRVVILPAGLEGRVRSLERHGQGVSTCSPGDRIAAALTGVEREAVRRGAVLLAADTPWEPAGAVDVRLALLPTAPRALTTHSRVRVHLGTAEVLARVQAAGPIPPGGSGFARLVLEEPMVMRGGDRAVLRSYSPVTTIGGAVVVDPLPPRRRLRWNPGLADPDPTARLVALLDRRPGGVGIPLLPVLCGLSPEACQSLAQQGGFVAINGQLLLESRVEEATRGLRAMLTEYHRAHPTEPGMPLETLRAEHGAAGAAALERLIATRVIDSAAGVVHARDFRPRAAGGDAMLERIIQHIERAALTPPSLPELEAELQAPGTAAAVRMAARSGRIVAVEPDRYFGAQALAGFTASLAALAARGPITPPAVREALGISRKYLIPLLEWADRSGLTVRDGDVRRPGPRLPPAAPPGAGPAG